LLFRYGDFIVSFPTLREPGGTKSIQGFVEIGPQNFIEYAMAIGASRNAIALPVAFLLACDFPL
jgi:hypothetical protein